MPLLFSILEHHNLLSKQPNYTCGLFFSDLMFMIMSWARAIMSISKKAWTFPGRPYYYIFPKINRKPNNSKTEGGEGHTGPPGQPRGGKAALQVPLSSRDLVTARARPGGSWQLALFGSYLQSHYLLKEHEDILLYFLVLVVLVLAFILGLQSVFWVCGVMLRVRVDFCSYGYVR